MGRHILRKRTLKLFIVKNVLHARRFDFLTFYKITGVCLEGSSKGEMGGQGWEPLIFTRSGYTVDMAQIL